MLLGSNSANLSLGIRVFLKDQFSKPTQAMTKNLKGLRGEFMAFQDNLKVGRNITAGIAAAGTVMLRGMAAAVSEGAEFLYIMRGVEAITDATASNMQRISALALTLGRGTMFTPEQVASGMRFMAMAGQTAQQIASTIPAATALAGATMTRLGGKLGAADILTNALKAFGWETKRSDEMADVLVAATTSANLSLLDLGNSMRYVAATSRNLNIPVQQTIGNLMTLGNAGIQATMAGTALENAYRYLANSLSSNASKKALEAWATLGMGKADILDSAGDLLPLTTILEKMRTSLQGFSSVDVQNIMKNIFGVRGQRAAATILKNLEEARGFANQLAGEGTVGTAQRKLQLMMDSTQGNILKLTSAWSGLQVAFTSAIGPTLNVLLKALTWVVGGLTDIMSTGFGKWLISAGSILVAVVTPILLLNAALATFAYAVRTLNISTANVMASMAFMRGAGARPAVAGRTITRAGHYRTYKSGARAWIKPATYVRGASKAVGGMTLGRGLAGLGRILGGFMSGPIGWAILAISIGIPLLTSAFSGNSKAVEDNTRALKATERDAKYSELMLALQNEKMGDILTRIEYNMRLGIREGLVSREAITEAIKNQDYKELLEYVLDPSGRVSMNLIPK